MAAASFFARAPNTFKAAQVQARAWKPSSASLFTRGRERDVQPQHQVAARARVRQPPGLRALHAVLGVERKRGRARRAGRQALARATLGRRQQVQQVPQVLLRILKLGFVCKLL